MALVTYSYRHTWKTQAFLNISLLLSVHKQVLHEAVLPYFALYTSLNKFKSRLNLYIEADHDHPSPCLESLGSLKNKQTPIPTSVETDLVILPSKSCKYSEKVQNASASLSPPLHSLLDHLAYEKY